MNYILERMVYNMKDFLRFLNKLLHTSIVNSFIVIIICFIIYKIIAYFLSDKHPRIKLFTSNRSKTYLRMIKSVVRYIFIIVTFLILLQINGINVSSMLAGVGIASVIVGFAIQDLLKDIIKGLDIISDQYFQVGDIIKYQDIEAKVIAIGLKCTKVKDVRTFNIISISNRNIEQVEVVSDLINIEVPLPYDLKLSKAEGILKEIVDYVSEIVGVDKCEYVGVNKIDNSSINYQVKIYCKPILKIQMKRDVLRCILLILESHNISIPYQQIDIHQK